MPELPEVETVVRQLQKKIVGKTITHVNTTNEKIVSSQINTSLPLKIKKISRRAKLIIFELSNNFYLLAHLRMTGHFYHLQKNETQKKYHQASFIFSDNSHLTYNSIRKFGSVCLYTKEELNDKLKHLGYEPLAKSFTSKLFTKTIKNYPKSIIKNKIMDQNLVVGVGNIYAQEALYHAGIKPQKRIKQVSKKKLALLHEHIQRILRLSIENNGTTVQNFLHIDGKGDFQDLLAVYQKQACPKGHPIKRIVVGQRGTYYCTTCQK